MDRPTEKSRRLGAHIRQKRMEKDLTQSQLAKKLGNANLQGQVSKWEAGRVVPDERHVQTMAIVFKDPEVWGLAARAREEIERKAAKKRVKGGLQNPAPQPEDDAVAVVIMDGRRVVGWRRPDCIVIQSADETLHAAFPDQVVPPTAEERDLFLQRWALKHRP